MTQTQNMPRMIEYRDCKPGMESTRTLLREETRQDSYGNRHKWELWHKTPGYECAGAAMRLVTRECWGVITRIDGCTYGAWLKTLPEAEELLRFKGEVIV